MTASTAMIAISPTARAPNGVAIHFAMVDRVVIPVVLDWCNVRDLLASAFDAKAS